MQTEHFKMYAVRTILKTHAVKCNQQFTISSDPAVAV